MRLLNKLLAVSPYALVGLLASYVLLGVVVSEYAIKQYNEALDGATSPPLRVDVAENGGIQCIEGDDYFGIDYIEETITGELIPHYHPAPRSVAFEKCVQESGIPLDSFRKGIARFAPFPVTEEQREEQRKGWPAVSHGSERHSRPEGSRGCSGPSCVSGSLIEGCSGPLCR